MKVRIAIAPEAAIEGVGRPTDVSVGPLRERVAEAVERGGGEVAPLSEADGLVWLLPGGPGPLTEALDAHPHLRWVQLPWAGVEHFTEVFSYPQVFTCAKGSYAKQVSEHALMLALACLRDLVRHARAPHWNPIDPRSLGGLNVTILGGGGIATELVNLLRPFNCRVRVLRRRAGAARTPGRPRCGGSGGSGPVPRPGPDHVPLRRFIRVRGHDALRTRHGERPPLRRRRTPRRPRRPGRGLLSRPLDGCGEHREDRRGDDRAAEGAREGPAPVRAGPWGVLRSPPGLLPGCRAVGGAGPAGWCAAPG
jgi:hypothetical protein